MQGNPFARGSSAQPSAGSIPPYPQGGSMPPMGGGVPPSYQMPPQPSMSTTSLPPSFPPQQTHPATQMPPSPYQPAPPQFARTEAPPSYPPPQMSSGHPSSPYAAPPQHQAPPQRTDLPPSYVPTVFSPSQTAPPLGRTAPPSFPPPPQGGVPPSAYGAPPTQPPSPYSSQMGSYPPQQQQHQQHAAPNAYTGGMEPPVQQFQQMGFTETRAPAPKIEPSQMPSPVAREGDVIVFKTDVSRVPPSPISRFHVVDEGNCSPRFMRMTTYQVPYTSDLQNESSLPFAALIQPLADTDPSEGKVPVVDFGSNGPLRCRRCRGYINPFVVFVDGGKQYTCSLCSFTNEVPLDYFSPLEPSGRRVDLFHRPELSKGSVDFVATGEYIWRTPAPMPVLFVVDVSASSVASGLLKTFIHSIIDLLDTMPPDSQVGFITYDNNIHFYNFSTRGQLPHMMVVSDISSAFVPLGEGVLVEYQKAKHLIQALLDRLPVIFTATSASATSCPGSALEAAALALEPTGGKVIFLQSALPTVGTGILKPRETESSVVDTDKESLLFKPQTQFYTEVGVRCAEKHIGVHLFLCSDGPLDVATVGEVSRVTGGQVYYYPNILSETERQRFIADLEHNLSRTQGYEAIMRTRCSTGLSVKGYHGHFHATNKTDISLANIDCDKTIAVTFQHDTNIPDNAPVVLQTALLYTSSKGERRIRIHTIALTSTSHIANLFKSADLHTLINVVGRQAILEASKTTLQKARNSLIADTTAPLFTYRKYCASASSGSSQLILPDSLKLLPIFTLSMLKSVLFISGAGIRPDYRMTRYLAFNSMSPALTSLLVYPHLYALHNLPPEVGTEDESGAIRLPITQRLTTATLENGGIYLMDDGHDIFLWVSRSASPELLSNILGVTSVDHIDPLSFTLRELGNEDSDKVCKVVETVRAHSGNRQPIYFLRQGGPFEGRFFMRLIEDKIGNQPSYTEFLCSLHRHIQNKLSGEAASQRAMKAMAEWG